MKLKPYLIIAVLLYAVVAGWQLGTPYIKGVMFTNEIEDQTRFMNFGNEIRARNRLSDTIKQLDIPIKPEDLRIVKNEETKQLLIEAQYEIPVTIPFGLYTHVWKFHPRSEFRMGDVPVRVK